MRPHSDAPPNMSRADRLEELGQIFAAAILRLRIRSALTPEPAAGDPPACLEVPSETVLLDHRG